MKKVSQMDNVEFVKHLMTFSHGRAGAAMIQMFVVDALIKGAEAVVKVGREEVRRQFGKNSFIHPDAWYEVAVEIKKAMDEKYGGK